MTWQVRDETLARDDADDLTALAAVLGELLKDTPGEVGVESVDIHAAVRLYSVYAPPPLHERPLARAARLGGESRTGARQAQFGEGDEPWGTLHGCPGLPPANGTPRNETAQAAKLGAPRSRHPRIAGIGIWVMGQEAAGFWSLIERRLR